MDLLLSNLRARLGYARTLSIHAARTIGFACRRVISELRQLNGVGANASSRRARVRIIKQRLARRG